MFIHEVLEYRGASQEALDAIEAWQIKKRGTRHPRGYNLKSAGNGGSKHSVESKRKISASVKRVMWNDERREKQSALMKKRWSDPGFRSKVIASRTKPKIRKDCLPEKPIVRKRAWSLARVYLSDVMDMKSNGMSFREIANVFGCSHVAVFKMIEGLKIDPG